MEVPALRFIYYNWQWTIFFILVFGASIGVAVGVALRIAKR